VNNITVKRLAHAPMGSFWRHWTQGRLLSRQEPSETILQKFLLTNHCTIVYNILCHCGHCDAITLH